MRDYRHEELIGGKERTLKVGDRVKTIDGKVGVIHECSPCDQYWIDFGDGEGYDAYTPWQLQCIPVEPERVKEDAFPQWHPPCGFQGLCHNGWGSKWCAECPWFDKAPSPGLLQRMGMATWPSEARDWFCISQFWPSAHSMTETEAKEMCRGESLRAFRWSQGVQG